ncbi:MAG: acyl-ACP desaturase [Candidatus Sericytochromatia bacterium]
MFFKSLKKEEVNEFEKYYEMSEKTGWRTTDLNWDKIDKNNISDIDKQAILATAVIEHGVPHYTETWSMVKGIEKEWELWQFVTLWAGEEHRHSYALKKLADTLDITGKEEYYLEPAKGKHYYEQISNTPFAKLHKEHCKTDCYSSIAGMLTYTAIQELVTAKYYQSVCKQTNSKFIKELLTLIAKDELKHHAFYANAIKRYYEKSDNKEIYLKNIYDAVVSFEMPHTIYDKNFNFFDKYNMLGKLDLVDIKFRVGKFLSFSPQLIKDLVSKKEFYDPEVA